MVTFCNPYERAVNAWECSTVDPMDRRPVTDAEARAIVAHVWQLAELPHKPPTVLRRGREDGGYVPGAMAYVTEHGVVVLQTNCPTTIILHECAHILTDDPLRTLECRVPVERAVHGPVWLSNYVWLLDKLMGPAYNTFRLRGTMPAELKPGGLPFYPTVWGRARPDLCR